MSKQGEESNWIDEARAHTEPRYHHLLGKQAPADAKPLAFLRCDCGMLELTKPALNGEPVRCANCKRNAESNFGALQVPQLRRPAMQVQSSGWVLAVLLLGLAALWIGNRVAEGPSRDEAIRSMEPAS
jgi:hypothetical protein